MMRYNAVFYLVFSSLILPCSLYKSTSRALNSGTGAVPSTHYVTSSYNVKSSTHNIIPSDTHTYTVTPTSTIASGHVLQTKSTKIVQSIGSIQPSFSSRHISNFASTTNSLGFTRIPKTRIRPVTSMPNPNITGHVTMSNQLSSINSSHAITSLSSISMTRFSVSSAMSRGLQISSSTLNATTSTSAVLTSTLQTTPKPSFITKNMNCMITGGCCTKALSQFPRRLVFEENQTPVLVPIFGVDVATFYLSVVDPPELRGLIEDNFNISRIGNKFLFQIVKYIDLEDLYLKTGKNERVTNFQLQVLCIDDMKRSMSVPPLTINITILDVDDTMPLFLDNSDHDKCVVPVYTANTSETFVLHKKVLIFHENEGPVEHQDFPRSEKQIEHGELQISPTHIRAVDGDLTQSNNISYSIMHAEPLDFDIFFELNISEGTVTKTKKMNSSNPTKYVLFVEATEDSPDQQSRVAILAIQIVPSVIVTEDIHKVNPNVKLALEIASVVVIAGFISGFAILICHRKRIKKRKVEVDDEIRDYKLQTIAVYESSCSSLNTIEPDVPAVVSPSTITVAPAKPNLSPYAAVRNKRFIRRERSPIDTALRPAWNAPKPKTKPIKYNPYSKKKK